MDYFHPHDMILKAQKLKYKALALPAILIIICFVLSLNNIDGTIVKYASFTSLLVYLYLIILYRYKRFINKPEDNEVVAPVNGKVINKNCLPNGCIVTIQKPFFASAEIITCTKSDIPKVLDMHSDCVSWEIKSKNAKIFINETVNYQAILIGLVPGPAICEVFIPSKYSVLVSEGDSLKAGESILAETDALQDNDEVIDE